MFTAAGLVPRSVTEKINTREPEMAKLLTQTAADILKTSWSIWEQRNKEHRDAIEGCQELKDRIRKAGRTNWKLPRKKRERGPVTRVGRAKERYNDLKKKQKTEAERRASKKTEEYEQRCRDQGQQHPHPRALETMKKRIAEREIKNDRAMKQARKEVKKEEKRAESSRGTRSIKPSELGKTRG